MSIDPVPDDLLPLSSAAASAYAALGRNTAALGEGVLDVVAIALAACTPLYGAREAAEPLRRLSDADLAGGKFVQGAARVHFPSGGTAFTRLAVSAQDLAVGIAHLQRAGVNFSHARFEPAPRRIPRVAPA